DRMIFAGRCRGNPVTRGRRRIDEFAHARMTRRLEHVHGTLDVDIHVFQRTLDRRDDVPDASEVKYIVGTAKQARVGRELANVALLERQAGVAGVVRQVGGSAPAQVVDYAHAVVALEQDVDHVAADEAGAAGHHRNLARLAHFAPSFFMVRTLYYQSWSKLFGMRWLRKARVRSRTASSMLRLGLKPRTRFTLFELT